MTTGYWVSVIGEYFFNVHLKTLKKIQGVTDCINEIITGEGYRGFYRGFGAVIIQYGIQLAVIRLSTVSVHKIIELFKEEPLPPISIRPDGVALQTPSSKGKK